MFRSQMRACPRKRPAAFHEVFVLWRWPDCRMKPRLSQRVQDILTLSKPSHRRNQPFQNRLSHIATAICRYY